MAGMMAHAGPVRNDDYRTISATRLPGPGKHVLALARATDLLAAVGPGLGAHLAAGEGEADDRPLHHRPLLPKRSGVVREVVALADLAHPGRDLAVARARHVGIQVVLDLVAEVAADHVEQRAAVDVGGADQLADVARPARLVGGLLLGEGVGLIGEVPA